MWMNWIKQIDNVHNSIKIIFNSPPKWKCSGAASPHTSQNRLSSRLEDEEDEGADSPLEVAIIGDSPWKVVIIGDSPWEVVIIGDSPWEVFIIGESPWEVVIIDDSPWEVVVIGDPCWRSSSGDLWQPR